MQIKFPKVRILQIRHATSKAGNPFSIVQFLDEVEYKVYEVFVSGDSLAVAGRLYQGEPCELCFEVSPNNGSAGVRLELLDALLSEG